MQEWKNVLLRGHDPEQLDRYFGRFEALEASIGPGVEAILATDHLLPEARALVDSHTAFLTQLGLIQ